MSPPSHDDRLRWQAVISQFKNDVFEDDCAWRIGAAQERVIYTATLLMREVFEDWNASRPIYRLPPEALASCFSFLSLEDLFAVTHVSRRWRATALGCPRLWATLTFTPCRFTRPEIMDMAISRAAQLPLELIFGYANSQEALGLLMHRIRRLEWTDDIEADFILRPAPLLESFACRLLRPIPENFLGGLPGSLCALTLKQLILPQRCPALSTLTALSAGLPKYEREAESLAGLFSICPVLEHLELCGVRRFHYQYLTSSVPTHLHSLTLGKANFYCADLMLYVRAWGPTNPLLSSIQLRSTPEDAAPVFQDAETLIVSWNDSPATVEDRLNGDSHVTITATNTLGHRFTLSVQSQWFDYDKTCTSVARTIEPHIALLAGLRDLRAPVTVLAQLFSAAPDLPALRSLTVLVDKHGGVSGAKGSAPVFPATQLAFLACTASLPLVRLVIASQSIETLTIDELDSQSVLTALADALPAHARPQDVDVILRGLVGVTAESVPRVRGYRIIQREDEDKATHPASLYGLPFASYSLPLYYLDDW